MDSARLKHSRLTDAALQTVMVVIETESLIDEVSFSALSETSLDHLDLPGGAGGSA